MAFDIILGWIPGLVIAIVSIILSKGIEEHAKLFVGRVSFFVIVCSLFWAVLELVANLLRHSIHWR